MNELAVQGELFVNKIERTRTGIRSRGRKVKDIVGQRYGRLVVIKKLERKTNGQTLWLCRCDCGHEIKAAVGHLERKSSPLDHCGCLGIDKTGIPKPGTRGVDGFNSGRPKHKGNNPTVALRGLLASYRNMAKSRGIAWNLSTIRFQELTKMDCHYCGVKPSVVRKHRGHEYVYSGVDRVDSKKGYTEGNCVSCCGTCNIAKNDMGYDEFIRWVDRVYNYQHGERDG